MKTHNLLTTSEVAVLLRLAPVTLCTWRTRGTHPRLRYTRLGRRVRYFESDVLEWARSMRHPIEALDASSAVPRGR